MFVFFYFNTRHHFRLCSFVCLTYMSKLDINVHTHVRCRHDNMSSFSAETHMLGVDMTTDNTPRFSTEIQILCTDVPMYRVSLPTLTMWYRDYMPRFSIETQILCTDVTMYRVSLPMLTTSQQQTQHYNND